jgi:ABC-2 type transport system permease protein
MTLWRLEWLRLLRTRRWIALTGVFVFFGFIGPATVRYAQQIFEALGSSDEVSVMFPDPIAADGVASYVANAMQVGLVVLAVVAAGALSFDGDPAYSVFFRTRVGSLTRLVVPRFGVSAIAGVLAFTAGSLAAWYESAVLLGSVPAREMLLGTFLCSLYLVFAVAVVAFASSIVRSKLNTVMLSLAIVILMPILGLIGRLAEWLPSRLVSAPEMLLSGDAVGDYLRPAAVTVVFSAALVRLAVAMSSRREI